MDFSFISTTAKNLSRTVDRNSPTILTALAVGGVVSTVFLAIKATAKAQTILFHEFEFRAEQWSEQTGEVEDVCPDFEPREIIELTWKEYIPTAIMGAITITCMVSANHISLRRNAALASLLSIAETTLKEYQEKVKEQIGEKKAEKIESEIAQDRVKNNPPDEKTIILTGKGDYLCLDKFSGRYFRSDIESIRKAENVFNQRLLREGWLGINEFYYEIGLDSIELGEEMGWIAERQLLELKYTSTNGPDYEPALVIDYRVQPHHI